MLVMHRNRHMEGNPQAKYTFIEDVFVAFDLIC